MIDASQHSGDKRSFFAVGPGRSLALCTFGAIVGLVLAGFGLFTAKGTRTAGVPVEDVAVVNQVPILMSDYVQQVQALYGVPLSQATSAQKKAALDGMVREELYVQRGIELGLQSDTIEVREALVGAVEALSAADATMAQPTEKELRDYYTAHIGQFETEGMLALADYVLPLSADHVQLAQAAAELRAGHASPVLARRTDVMKDGEEFYFAARIHMGRRLFDVARTIKSGEVSPPTAMPDGIHLMAVTHNTMPVAIPFEEARDRVLSSYIATQTKALTAANERFLLKRADIQTAKGFE